MGEMSTEGANASAGIDLSQFYEVFFEEAGENLERMEQQLLAIDVAAADDEELNAIFRCAHSIKGGAATFGFADVAELTHQMETLLDKLRRHELALTPPMVDVLLQAGDALRSQLGRHQGAGGDVLDTTELLVKVRAFVSGQAAPAAPVAAAPAATAPAPQSAPAAVPVPATRSDAEIGAEADVPVTIDGHRILELTLGPLKRPELAANIVELFKEIEGLGTIEPIDGGMAQDGLRRFRVTTASSDADLVDLFGFHVSREEVVLRPFSGDRVAPGYGFYAGAPGSPTKEEDQGFGFFEDAPGSPLASGAPAEGSSAAEAIASPAAVAAAAKPAARAEKAAAATLEASTLRVSVEKIDQLINLMGELVITQAMLAQNGRALDPVQHQGLVAGLT